MSSIEKGYLLDTSTLSAILDSKHSAHGKTAAVIGALSLNSTKWVCPITLGELQFGVCYSEWKTKTEATQLREQLAKVLSYDLLKTNRHTARLYGELKGKILENADGVKGKRKLRKIEKWVDAIKKKPFGISDNDLWIAAAALEHELTVVSNDRDFNTIKKYWPELEVIRIEPVVPPPATPAPTPVAV